MAEGFGDIEMKNRNIEDREEDREEGFQDLEGEKGETSFGGNNPEDNERASLLDTGNTRKKFNRVEDGALPKLKKVAGNIKRVITNDRKESFKNIFNVAIEKKNGKNSKILLENTKFEKDQNGNVSIIFKGQKIGNINSENEPELFVRKK